MGSLAGEDDAKRRYHDLCTNLNMDSEATDQAWNSYDQIKHNYTLEGDQIHWLACALYVACRTSTTPSVGSQDSFVEGNCVSLTKLLRLSKLSLIDFFSKCKKWADMVNLPKEFRDKVDRLERSFAVSMEIFKKYEPIFMEMFQSPTPPLNRNQKSRKQKNQPCTPNRLFGFCWTLFVSVKGKFKTVGDDLVNSYHLLLACCDMMFANALLADRRDLLNSNFSGLPPNFASEDYKPPKGASCIIDDLCKKFDGVLVEALGIKEYCLKKQIKGLFEQKIMKGDVDNLTGLLDIAYFDSNYKAVNRLYEEHVLNSGNFDERIFLAEFKRRQKCSRSLTTPARPVLRARNIEGDEASRDIGSPTSAIGHLAGDFAKKLQDKRFSSQLCPATPLTGRNYLESKETVGDKMPVASATQSITRLQTMVAGRAPAPSKGLLELFKSCSQDPTETIEAIVTKLEGLFCAEYSKHSQDAKQGMDFGPKRFELGKTLYYKFVETMLVKEKKRKPDCDISTLLHREIVHQTLLACCLQLVLFSYNTGHTFPWILTTLKLEPYHFFRIIEIVVRNEEQLCRAMVKHLNSIEEHILETMAWSSDSPLWAEIESSKQTVPSCEDVSFPVQLISNDQADGSIQQSKTQSGVPGSPVSSVSDRFQTPVESHRLLSPTSAPGPARKRLFSSEGSESPANAQGTQVAKTGQSLLQTKAVPVTFYSVKVENGQLRATTVTTTNNINAIRSPVTTTGANTPLTAVTTAVSASANTLLKSKCVSPTPATTANGSKDSANSNTAATPAETKPRRTGSLCLFFRKFYHLASIRNTDLCEKLTLKETELKRKIWTCFEHIIINHIDIMKDRHLDQILMCTVYVVCKVSNNSREFLGIMKCYRGQPQADSHIYRSVLLSRSTNESGEDHGESPANSSNNVNCYAGERRGDLIKFYNDVYVKKVQTFAAKLSTSSQQTENLTLSPLPLAKPTKPHPMSPRFRVSDKHQMYISTLAPQDHPTNSPNLLEYRFSRSPARDLDAINLRIQQQDNVSNKRLRLENLDGEPMAKKPATAVTRKIQGILGDRRGQAQE